MHKGAIPKQFRAPKRVARQERPAGTLPPRPLASVGWPVRILAAQDRGH